MNNNNERVRIGILGTGAIGGFYGLMLVRQGLNVRFLARTDYQQLNDNGLQVHSEELGDLQQAVKVCHTIEELADCQWILVTAKTTANADIARLLSRLPNSTANVVLMQNGFGNEAAMRPLIPASMRLFAGLCFIYARRTAPGVIRHQGGGMLNIAYHSGMQDEEAGQAVAQELVDLFGQAGIRSQQVDLLQARWQKLVWNVPYNGLSVVLDSTTSALMDHPATHALIVDLMQEVIAAAAAHGCSLSDKLVPAMLRNTAAMANYYPSMHADYAEGRKMELAAIYRAPLQEAERLGCSMPATRMLLQQLEFIESRLHS